MTDNERDTKFLGFAKLLQQEIWNTELSIVPMMTGGYPTSQVAKELTEALQTLIAQRAYDLEQSGCIDISNEQMRQGIRLHPHAMLRAVKDLTQWPESPSSE